MNTFAKNYVQYGKQKNILILTQANKFPIHSYSEKKEDKVNRIL